MKLSRILTISGLMAVLPFAAHAQTESSSAVVNDQAIMSPQTTTYGDGEDFWLASGFVGSNFGQDAEEASVDFGGTVGYLWRGMFGGEFHADFSPDFELEPSRSALLAGEQPWINSYMGNAIAAVPVGVDQRFQPYVSGGLGVLTLRADTLTTNGTQDDIEPDDSRFAGNVGGGLMGFAGNWGFRADLRYFRGFDQESELDPIESPAEDVGSRVLSELEFWRANVGLAIRW